jgi:hypothetical protein
MQIDSLAQLTTVLRHVPHGQPRPLHVVGFEGKDFPLITSGAEELWIESFRELTSLAIPQRAVSVRVICCAKLAHLNTNEAVEVTVSKCPLLRELRIYDSLRQIDFWYCPIDVVAAAQELLKDFDMEAFPHSTSFQRRF